MTSWNSGAEELTGYREAEMLGQPADLIFTEEDRAGGAPEREARQALGRRPRRRRALARGRTAAASGAAA